MEFSNCVATNKVHKVVDVPKTRMGASASRDCESFYYLMKGFGKTISDPENCCDIRDVVCTSGRIVELNYLDMNLRGVINSTALMNLNALKVFGIANNAVKGPLLSVPASLLILDIENNQLNGTLPVLPQSIEVVMISSNNFKGLISVKAPYIFDIWSTLISKVVITDVANLKNRRFTYANFDSYCDLSQSSVYLNELSSAVISTCNVKGLVNAPLTSKVTPVTTKASSKSLISSGTTKVPITSTEPISLSISTPTVTTLGSTVKESAQATGISQSEVPSNVENSSVIQSFSYADTILFTEYSLTTIEPKLDPLTSDLLLSEAQIESTTNLSLSATPTFIPIVIPTRVIRIRRNTLLYPLPTSTSEISATILDFSTVQFSTQSYLSTRLELENNSNKDVLPVTEMQSNLIYILIGSAIGFLCLVMILQRVFSKKQEPLHRITRRLTLLSFRTNETTTSAVALNKPRLF